MTRDEAEQLLDSWCEENQLFADGFDDAIIGVTTIPGGCTVVAYSYEKCIEILKADTNEEEAREHFEFNTIGSYVGPFTPLFVHTEAMNDY